MMNYLLLMVLLIALTSQSVFQKQFNLKEEKRNVYYFSAVQAFFSMLFFLLVSGGKLTFSLAFLPYSVGFMVACGAALLGMVYAILYGSFSITTLIGSCSLLIPTFYGIAFLHDSFGIFGYIGLALLLISLYLINKTEEEMKFSPKWLFWVLVYFVGNGMCSTVQKMQQLKFDGAYKSEFMIVALGMLAVFMLILGSVRSKERKAELRACGKYAAASGIGNGLTNFLVMVLGGLLPSAFLFPMISAGGMVLAFLLSVFVYREKLAKQQMIGYAIGIASIVFLNL